MPLKGLPPHKFQLALCFFLIATALCLLQIFQPDFLFNKSAIQAGEFWRLWTGHLVHTNWVHLFLNLASLSLFFLLFHDILHCKTLFIATFLISTGISFGFFLFLPELDWYAGLSGTIYGLYTLFSINTIYKKNYFTGSAILIILFSKVLLEQVSVSSSNTVSSLIEAPITVESHLYGVLCALMISTFLIISLKKKQ